ncbi:MAG: fumarylacetoacetate hydrolase family protein [Candidatus Kapabacteria bacterium]|nr:fumarylacetoacetate hydrolase family protein [Candidatus Kapabacteria bacterium]
MKLVSYQSGHSVRTGIVIGNSIVDMAMAHQHASAHGGMQLGYLPDDMVAFLRLGDAGMSDARRTADWAASNDVSSISVTYTNDVLRSPVPRPTSMRDGYAFRQHVESARRNRGLDMIPEFDEIPIFYFTNHNAVTGPGVVDVQDMHLDQLDFELECAIVIGKEGRNISAANADDHIAGYFVMNDWSARAMQMHEMKLNLGPAKGKDFATSLGPVLVTRDELASRRIETPHGEKYDLKMTTRLNGNDVSLGNVADMTWTFAQIIERASYGVTLYPGDVIGSGTCGTGCFLELNGSKVYNPPLWLKDGDVVECEIEMLGNLVNTVRRVGA